MKLETKIEALGAFIMISAAMPIITGITLIANDLGFIAQGRLPDLFWHALLTVFAIVTAYFLASACNVVHAFIVAAEPLDGESPLSSTYKELL